MTAAKDASERCSTGISGLDHVLGGGFPAHRFYLIQGDPGVGKTTLALQFLRRGAELGERGLYITLSETRAELVGVARSHGWELDGFDVLDLSAIEHQLLADEQNTVFSPSEVELNQTVRAILDQVARTQPRRVVFDSMSEMRLLAQQSLRFRRQMLSLKQHFIGLEATVLFLDDNTSGESDRNMQSLVHGVIQLEQIAPEYGAERRRLRVVKVRGSAFRGGWHDYVIRRGGIDVFPRLIAAEHHRRFSDQQLASGNAGFDALLEGGIDRGTSTLLLGSAGTGKSSFAALIAATAAARGDHATIYCFDENLHTYRKRAAALGIDIVGHERAGRIRLRQIDPAEVSAGELACGVRDDVERNDTRLIVIDSLNGYLNALSAERNLALQLHELLAYLGQLGVTTVMTMAQHGLLGSMRSPIDLTYIADTVCMLRYFEHAGGIRTAISVVKKRSGDHEREIREYRLRPGAIEIGEPLSDFRGVLTGVPDFQGQRHQMLGEEGGSSDG